MSVSEIESKKIFAQRLRYIREKVINITQEELASKTGVPSTSISHFESIKDSRKPSFDNIRILAKALKVTTDYLLGLSDNTVFSEKQTKVDESPLLYTALNELLYLTKEILGITQDILDEVRFGKADKEESHERN